MWSVKPEPHFAGLLSPALKWSFPLPSARFIAVSWVNSTQHSSTYSPLFLYRKKELALTGSGWCLDRGMMGRGNGKCYPTLSCMAQFSLTLLTLLPPPSTSVFFLCFTLLFSLLPLLLLLSSALAPLYLPIMESFWQNEPLTLPGCLCVELSKYGKKERGLGFLYSTLLARFAHEYGENKGGGKVNSILFVLYMKETLIVQ